MHRQHLLGRVGPKQVAGDPHHRLRRRPLPHPDHHRAVADRLHIPALHVAAAPVLFNAAQPDRELLGGEHGVEPVDRLHDHRFRHAGRLGHRVDRHPAEDPARRVALEQEVRQRRQQQRHRVRRLPRQARVLADVGPGHAADQELRHRRRLHRLHPLPGPPRGGDPHLPLAQDVAADPFPCRRRGQRLGQQPLGEENLDAAVAHRLDEHVVLGLGPGHPDHVVEQQFLRVRRRQAAVLKARPVRYDLAQPAHL